MKKILLTIIAATSLISATAQNNEFTISGTTENANDGDSIFLCRMEGFFSFIPEDTALVKNGAFLFKGKQEGATLRYLVQMHKGQNVGMADIVLENAPITVQFFKDEKIKPVVNGGPSWKLWNEMTAGEKVYDDQMEKPWQTSRDSTLSAEVRAKAKATVDSLETLLKGYHKKFLIEHIPSGVSDMMLGFYKDDLTKSELDNVLNMMKDEKPQLPYYKEMIAERAASAQTAIGKKYTDIALKGTNGKIVKVSNYVSKNKYTLIDFWASWCGPCRAEMPNVVKAYTKYHAKGLEVIGVSLDNNKTAWLLALKQLHMPWPQMSDLKGWQSAGAAAYNVKAIPSNVLINQKGQIIAKDLREEVLQKKLAELLK